MGFLYPGSDMQVCDVSVFDCPWRAGMPLMLRVWLCRAATPAPEAVAEASEPSSREAPAATNTSNHALIRSTVKALANSDEFIELLVRELQKSGVLQ